MSEIKVNKVTPRVACGTTQLGDSGDTITIPSGATIQNLGTATGFGGTGVVSWDTGSIKTAGFTAVTGTGYFCNTTGGAFTVTLPLSPAAGAVVGVSDYALTFDTNNLTLDRNGSNISGQALDSVIPTEGIAVTLVYVDATKGWIVTDSGLQSEAPLPTFVAATGGCITTCGNFKMHKFIGPGTFCVSAVGTPAGSDTVDYLVVGGGGGGGWCIGAGGGAGGIRATAGTASGSYCAGPSPLTSPVSAVPVSVQGYPLTVGGGGSGSSGSPVPGNATPGFTSTFNSVSAAGGGFGATWGRSGQPGGSGGGAGGWTLNGTNPGGSAGSGDTPATTPAQGNDGGSNSINTQDSNGAGGGGGTGVGTNSTSNPARTHYAPGGTGFTSAITSGSVTYSTGGRGLGDSATGTAAGAPNTGDGGDGAGGGTPGAGSNGGSGIVIIRYKYQ